MKVCVSYYQIVTQLSKVTAFVEPPAFRALLKVFNTANLFVGWIPGVSLGCLGMGSLEAALLFDLLAPLALFGLLGLVMRRRARKYVVMLLFLLAPAIQSRGFRVQAACDCFSSAEEGREACFLREDYSVVCDEATGQAPGGIRLLGWLNVAVYGLLPIAL